MEEILPSPKMADIDLLNKLEKISSLMPNRVLKVEVYILTKIILTWIQGITKLQSLLIMMKILL